MVEQRQTIQTLRAANEAVCSANEELEVSNEELTASREELQAANQELQQRNSELSRALTELDDLWSSIDLAIVMIDGDLRIRRFTKEAREWFRAIPEDVGRPLTDLNARIDIPEAVLRDTVRNRNMHEFDSVDSGGELCHICIRPHRAGSDCTQGAFIIVHSTSASNRLRAQP